MKKILLLLFLCPLLSVAQKTLPRFENDTLYTSSGYKIYKGETLHFGHGTGKDGKFRFTRVISATGSYGLTNANIVVEKVKDYAVSSLGNQYIKIVGSIVYKDGSKGRMVMHMAFERATVSVLGWPSELIIPAEFKIAPKTSTADQLTELYKLYQDSVLTKNEFDSVKAKILSQK
jgi:hypothetical protein